MNKPLFFRRADWISFGLTFLIALTVYTLTLQPTVGLEDSGELIVASDYLGVPHPPGYPIWSLLTWGFQWVFHKMTYHGYPNPAWAVNFFSAFAGAAACAVLALLVSRSGTDFLRSLKKASTTLGDQTERIFCCVAGISSGLLLAFSQGMWSQSVIAEVYSLNIFFQTLMLLFIYRWMVEPDNPKPLFLMAFVFGLGLTNHQTLIFMGLAVALAIGLRNIRLFRDFAIVGIFYAVMVALNKFGPAEWGWAQGPAQPAFWFWTVYAVVVPVFGLFLPNGKAVCGTCLLMLLGLSFYLYMPFASDQNPPINWGYPRTWEGFMHVITRGQYEGVTLANVFTLRFVRQIGAYLHDLRSQFFGPTALLALIPFVSLPWIGRKNRAWFLTTVLAFIGVGVIFMILQNPKIDIQTLFIARVQYIQSHAIYAIWLGYGLLLMMAWLETRVGNNPLTKWVGVLLVFLLPFSLIAKNYYSEKQLQVVGGSEQNGHDFGWQFGNWQLRGVEGIKEDLWYYCDQDQAAFDAEWAKYPNPDYPPPMSTNAVFFGGTDPGRFVPTYMIYCPKIRPDVYLITQNALADPTYQDVMGDLYGEQIWIPSRLDSNRAFNAYIEGVRSGKISAGADIALNENGQVRVDGVSGVMWINGRLAEQIFDHNLYISELKTNEATRQVGAAVVPNDPVDPETGTLNPRDFYVEESMPIPWMYPYLTPHGLIMKINNEPTEITRKMIKDDHDFWDWYVDRLVNDPKFIRDIAARKTFSKLRSSIGGLYNTRGEKAEAEYAFRQALQLYPLSPEANFRLANLYMSTLRFSDAREVVSALAEKDVNNGNTEQSLRQIDQLEKMIARRDELAVLLRGGGQGADVSNAFELVQIHCMLQEKSKAQKLVGDMLHSGLPPQIERQLAQMLIQMRQFDMAGPVLVKYLREKPDDLKIRIELAAIQTSAGRKDKALETLQIAVEKGGEPIRNLLRKDLRFRPVWNDPEFQKLVPPPSAKRLPFGAAAQPAGEFGGLSF